MSEPGQGDLISAIELPLDDGGVVRIPDPSGRALVLFFYPKDDTSGCTAEALDFSALAAEFEQAGAMVVGISPDSAESHAKFKTKHALSMPLAADSQRMAIEAFDVWKKKSMYGRTFMGVERSTFLIGPDGRIAQAWRKVSVAGHAAQVLQAVRDLMPVGT